MFGRKPIRTVKSFASDPHAFNGLWDGVVIDIKDPEKTGRVKVRIFDLHDEDTPTDQLPWAYPMFPAAFASLTDQSHNGGFFHVPPVDSMVGVLFRRGDPDFPVWTGCWAPKAPAITGREGYSNHVRRDVLYNADGLPTCPTWATAGGARVELDDDAGEIRVTTPGGQKLTLSDNAENEHHQCLKLEDSEGNYIWMDTSNKKIKIKFDGDMIQDVTGDFNINVGGSMKIKTGSDLGVTVGGNENRSASGNMNLAGTIINLNPTTPVTPATPETANQGTSTTGNKGLLERLGNQLRKLLTGN